MSGGKGSSSSWLSTTVALSVVMGGVVWYYWSSSCSTTTSSTEQGKEEGSTTERTMESSISTTNKEMGDMDSLVEGRFQTCVILMKEHLLKMPQNSQLEFYGLYKQASLGDIETYQSRPPPAYDLVATAKYKAWKSKMGMSKTSAMQEYIDKTVHFEFTRTILVHDGDMNDDDYELEGDAVIDMNGMGMKPSTLLTERTKEEELAEAEEEKAYPLHAAARNNQLTVLEELLQPQPGEENGGGSHGPLRRDPNELDPCGQTALHLAADAGNPEAIQILVRFGANIHAADHDGISVLQAAVIAGDVETCRLLCVLGANPDQPDSDGDTPRGCAQDDPILKDLLFRASQGTLEIDDDFQTELQTIGKTAAAAAAATTTTSTSLENDIAALDEIPVDLADDEDGDMF